MWRAAYDCTVSVHSFFNYFENHLTKISSKLIVPAILMLNRDVHLNSRLFYDWLTTDESSLCKISRDRCSVKKWSPSDRNKKPRCKHARVYKHPHFAVETSKDFPRYQRESLLSFGQSSFFLAYDPGNPSIASKHSGGSIDSRCTLSRRVSHVHVLFVNRSYGNLTSWESMLFPDTGIYLFPVHCVRIFSFIARASMKIRNRTGIDFPMLDPSWQSCRDYFRLQVLSIIIETSRAIDLTFCIISLVSFLFFISEISGPAKTQTAARPSFYDEEDETVYGSAEMEKMENKPLSVDNTINGHIGYPSVATPVPTVRIGKKRPTIGASSRADDRHSAFYLLVIVLLLIVARQRYQWTNGLRKVWKICYFEIVNESKRELIRGALCFSKYRLPWVAYSYNDVVINDSEKNDRWYRG